MKRTMLAAAAALLFCWLAGPARAEPGEVVLKNGDVLKGEVSETKDEVVVEHAVLGRLVLARSSVSAVRLAAVEGPDPASHAPYEPGEKPSASAALATLCGGPCPCEPAAPVCEKPWHLKVTLAASLTSGNSDTAALVAAAEYTRKVAPWAFKAGVGFVYTEADGDVTANRWSGIVRGDRDLGHCSYLFAQVLFDRDEQSDLEYRFTPTAGYGRYLFQRPDQELKAEIGGGIIIEKYVDLDQTIDPAGYFGAHYVKKWADKRKFTADLDFIPNLNDFDLSAGHLLLAYGMPLCKELSLVIGAKLDYVVDPPVEDVESWDLLLTVGVTLDM